MIKNGELETINTLDKKNTLDMKRTRMEMKMENIKY